MKKIFFILATLFALQTDAQQSIITPIEKEGTILDSGEQMNHYFSDVNGVFDKFLGNWIYQSGNDRVEITITKKERYFTGTPTVYEDVLYIFYKYTQNGVVVYDLFNSNPESYILGGRFPDLTNVNKYRAVYAEVGQHIFRDKQFLLLEYIPGTPAQLKWDATYETRAEFPTRPKMPLNMVFVKQ